MEKTCNNCCSYKWYDDYCSRWKCKVDYKSVHSCFRTEADRKREFQELITKTKATRKENR